jgi:hypothetical protein
MPPRMPRRPVAMWAIAFLTPVVLFSASLRAVTALHR